MPKIHGSPPSRYILRNYTTAAQSCQTQRWGHHSTLGETNASAVLRRDPANALAQNCNLLEAVGQMDSCLRGSPIGDAQPATPLGRRTDGPRRKAAAAIGTDVVQLRLDALRTEGALEGTNASVRRIGRQVLVAKLAIGSELECHFRSLDSG